MNMDIKFLFFLYLISLSFVNITTSRVLIQIQTLTRHGERSPCFTYPADPYKHAWTKGLGQLTSKGKHQLKEVGQFLRNYYHNFLPKTFHKKEVYIRSSDTDRTISSALAAMSTLFDNEIVPVHTVPKSYDYLLKMTSVCPYHKKLLSKEYKLEKYVTLFDEYSSFFKDLEYGTGLPHVDFHMAVRICDAITVWSQLNLTFPDWLNSESVNKCLKLGDMKFIVSYSNILLTKFRGGPLANNMVDTMVERAKTYLLEKPGMKMIGFFAHDSTMSAFLGHIGSFNKMKPPLASLIILELYHDSETIDNQNPLAQFYVRLLFRNNTRLPPYVLNISICYHETNSNQIDCRLDILYKNLQLHAITDLSRECGLTNIIDHWFASVDKKKVNYDSLAINDGELKSSITKPRYETDLFMNILFPLLLVEILIFYIVYRLFKR